MIDTRLDRVKILRFKNTFFFLKTYHTTDVER